ncbi:MAG: fibronectin type III domain-containing protein [Candidatus Dormibacterales bacterium]
MHRWFALILAAALAMAPVSADAGSPWGSPEYGDPPGWCTNLSDMWASTVVTNDPLVGTNPERDTFYGFDPSPAGYDDWYGFFYGDFRGSPGDASGWVKLLHEDYPLHYHWNFADSGWAVHGHVKEYIAYYNWTYGGQCRLGVRGANGPPPYMADRYGYPVVDIYVDSVPPFPPSPYVTDITPTSVSFTWNPVADRGDGAGRDYFASGMDHYVSWLTVSDRVGAFQVGLTASPRVLEFANLVPGERACVHVQAVDKLQNSTADQSTCAAPLVAPPMPVTLPQQLSVQANPGTTGLAGLDSWLWLSPPPSTVSMNEVARGTQYLVTATPVGADWDFGDGTAAVFQGAQGFGTAYPQPSAVSHVYQAEDQAGYTIGSSVRYQVTWAAVEGGRTFGPYPLGTMRVAARPLAYPVQQAQPELILV